MPAAVRRLTSLACSATRQGNVARTGTQIQILSDLHLEIGQQYDTFAVPPAAAPYLVLAGDIGRLLDYVKLRGFLAKLVPSYRRVFYVLGNHEFYGMAYAAAVEEAGRLTREPALQGKLTLLHRTRWDEAGQGRGDGDDKDRNGRLTVLGCTLWSDVPAKARQAVALHINDFRQIYGWTVESHIQQHAEEAAWLRQQVAAIDKEAKEQETSSSSSSRRRTVLIVTHHAPSLRGTSAPKHEDSPWKSAFATEMILSGGGGAPTPWPGVAAWVFGHTHLCMDEMRCGIRMVANQRGYVIPGALMSHDPKAGIYSYRLRERQSRAGLVFDPAKTIAVG